MPTTRGVLPIGDMQVVTGAGSVVLLSTLLASNVLPDVQAVKLYQVAGSTTCKWFVKKTAGAPASADMVPFVNGQSDVLAFTGRALPYLYVYIANTEKVAVLPLQFTD